MSKRHAESTLGVKVKVKRLKGIKVRTIIAPDSDEEVSRPKIDVEYARLVKTRISTSGKLDSTRMNTLQHLEVEAATRDDPAQTVVHEDSQPTIYPCDGAPGTPPPSKPKKRQRKKANDSTKMRSWVADQQSTVLDEIVARDGPGDNSLDSCNSCGKSCVEALYRCLECSYRLLYCGECVVKSHTALPLHRFECWNGKFFDRASLDSLGYICTLGHGGGACPAESPPSRLIIIDANGWHKLKVRFCHCGASDVSYEHYRQLLRMGWYPASSKRPRTAFTFDLLETYHKVTLQGKLNLYDFYHAIMQKSDNQGRSKPIFRYHEISRCVRQWRNLKIAKRGGGAHQEYPLSETPPGAFAVECPACPHPERNLPYDWEDPSHENHWIYTLFLAIDANFKLKLKNRLIQDPELGSGWSYFVEIMKYIDHVASNPHEKEVETCGTEFHAVNSANSRGGKDYITNGVVMVVCARHCFILPNAVGDLRYHERYINTDYVVASCLRRCLVKMLKLSYDIACKWSVNLPERFKIRHGDINLSNFLIEYLVPKFHLPAHGAKCQTLFSFNYTRGVGRTHGETVEQEWAYINLAALSTREMGPGARHATLDDSWGGWNWRKVLGLGSLLETNLIKAKDMASTQRKVADDFTATFPGKTIMQWKRMVDKWEADPSRPNPYVSNDRASKISEIRLRLAQEEAEEAQSGQRAPHQISGSVFVRMGLELEDQQRELSSTFEGKTRTDAQRATLLERRSALLHQIKKWRELQAIYMPCVLSTNVPDAGSSESRENAEGIKLWLPSELDMVERGELCSQSIITSERELRFGQLHDALEDLRKARCVRRGLFTFHKVQLASEGQKTQTKSRAVMKTVEDRIARAVRRYRAARNALLRLDPSGSWKELYLVLSDNDNRGPGKEPDEVVASDGCYVPSWIWLSNANASAADGDSAKTMVSPNEVNEDMRVEWAQCVARADRWEEELVLLQEEMRRVVHFLDWKSRDWVSKANRRAGVVMKVVSLGIFAYAHKQGSIYRNLAIRYAQRWCSTLASTSLPHVWATEFLEAQGAPLADPDAKKPNVDHPSPAKSDPAAANLEPPTTNLGPPIATSRYPTTNSGPLTTSAHHGPQTTLAVLLTPPAVDPKTTACASAGYESSVASEESDSEGGDTSD